MSELVKVRVPLGMKAGFDKALKENGDDGENLLYKWISNYVEVYEENLLAKRLHEVADRLDKLKKRPSTI